MVKEKPGSLRCHALVLCELLSCCSKRTVCAYDGTDERRLKVVLILPRAALQQTLLDGRSWELLPINEGPDSHVRGALLIVSVHKRGPFTGVS